MHQSSRRRVIDVLSAIRNNCTIEALGYKAERNAKRRLRSPDELEKIFIGYHDAVINSITISRSCTFSLDELHHEYPAEISFGESPHKKLIRLTYEGLAWRIPEKFQIKCKNKQNMN